MSKISVSSNIKQTQKGNYLFSVIIDGKYKASRFIKKDQVDKLKDAEPQEVGVKSIHTKRGERYVIYVKFPGIEVSRFVNKNTYNDLKDDFEKRGGSLGAVLAANLSKVPWSKIIEPVMNLAAPIVGQLAANALTPKEEGKGIFSTPNLSKVVEPLLNLSPKKGKGPRVTRLPGYGLQPDEIYVGEGIGDIKLNEIANYFRTAPKQLIKNFGKQGINLLANVIDKVGAIPFNQFAKQLRGEGIMYSGRGILPSNFNQQRVTEILKMIHDDPKLRKIAGIRKRKGGAIGTILASTLIPLALNAVLPIIKDKLFK